jgi:hypothetical protein
MLGCVAFMQRGARQMRSLGLGGYALCSCVAAALLAGCGGSQPPIGTPGALPQTSMIATHADRSGSWMLPEAKGDDLLYVVTDATKKNAVRVYSYPQGKLVGAVSGLSGKPIGLCSDKTGDVFVTQSDGPSAGFVSEYAHGSTTPMETLSDPDYPQQCSVDPSSGNLAVVNYRPGNVAVYAGARGTPAIYDAPTMTNVVFCTYDDKGNLYVSGDDASRLAFAKLAVGDTQLTDFTETANFYGKVAPVQWDGWYLSIGNSVYPYVDSKSYFIYRVRVFGSRGKVVHTSKLLLTGGKWFSVVFSFWIQGKRIILPMLAQTRFHQPPGQVTFWKYPAAGSRVKTIPNVGKSPWTVTVSLAPH